MKKVFSLMLFVTSFLCFTSCSNDEDEFYTPQEVDFTLDYTFVESVSMTRATGESVYNDFYESHILTKELTPKTYSLRFTNIETNAYAEFNGRWDCKDGVRLKEGKYIVTGNSTPKQKGINASDSVYLTFQDTVQIVKDMAQLTLKADYNAFLLMFDAENIKAIAYNPGDNNNSSFPLNKTEENIYYIFMTGVYNQTTNIAIGRNNNLYSYIYLNKTPFEKGKYYYFNDMTNSFDIPKMESGN